MDDKLDQMQAVKILNLLINGNGGKEETVTFTNQDGKPITFDVSGHGIRTQADLKGYRDAMEEVVSHLPPGNKIGDDVTKLLDARTKDQFVNNLGAAKSTLNSAVQPERAAHRLEEEAKSITPRKAGMILEKAVGKFEGKNWSFDPDGFGKGNPTISVEVGKLTNNVTVHCPRTNFGAW